VTPQRRLQHSFGDGLIREEISELWEPWMRQAGQILEDDALVAMVQTLRRHESCSTGKFR
jgi:hypothetical protein